MFSSHLIEEKHSKNFKIDLFTFISFSDSSFGIVEAILASFKIIYRSSLNNYRPDNQSTLTLWSITKKSIYCQVKGLRGWNLDFKQIATTSLNVCYTIKAVSIISFGKKTSMSHFIIVLGVEVFTRVLSMIKIKRYIEKVLDFLYLEINF